MAKKKKQGGKRLNAGRKSAFTEPTKTVSFRCPLSKIEEVNYPTTQSDGMGFKSK